MPKNKWLDTLKQTKPDPKDGGTYESSVYKKTGSNLALNDLDDEAADDENEWTFGKEIYGHDVEVIHDIQLRQEGGIEACLRSKYDMSQCYVARLALKSPHIKRDTVEVFQKIFPNRIANGVVKGGRVMNILGFDKYLWSVDHGCSLISLYMHDGRLDLQSYAGNYGGRGNLRPLHPSYPLEVIQTPDWIWTPEKP